MAIRALLFCDLRACHDYSTTENCHPEQRIPVLGMRDNRTFVALKNTVTLSAVANIRYYAVGLCAKIPS
jgi:hypothetical protein